MENGQMNYVMGGNSISMAGTDSISDLTRKEAIKEFNKANKKAEDAYRKNIDEQIAKSNENKKRAEDLEIVPSGPYILVKLYNENPYEQITQTDSGLILPAFDGKEFSRETGQMEKQEKAVEIAHVIEVGPDVKYVTRRQWKTVCPRKLWRFIPWMHSVLVRLKSALWKRCLHTCGGRGLRLKIA